MRRRLVLRVGAPLLLGSVLGGSVLLVPVGFAAAPAAGPAAAPAQSLVERLIAKATGGNVVVQGLHGGFSDHVQIAHLELHDTDGAWLSGDGVTIDWSPLALVRGRAEIQKLTIEHLALPRLPVSAPPAPGAAPAAPAKPFSLPVTVDLKEAHVGRGDIAAALLGGVAASVALDGALHLQALDDLTTHLALRRLDGGGSFTLDALVGKEQITAKLAVAEPEGGLLASVAHLPALGALRLDAALDGKRSALATTLHVSAGPLQASATGTVDLEGSAADLTVSAAAPAMTPAPGVSWQAVKLDAKVQGKFAAPDAQGTLTVTELAAGGGGVGTLTAELQGNAGRIGLHAVAERLRVPLPQPGLLQAAPLVLDATVALADPARPVQFTLSHPLLQAKGEARTAGTPELNADVALAQLAPFAALGGVDLQGSTALHVHAVAAASPGDATAAVTPGGTLEADGTLSVTGGLAPVPALVGQGAKIGLTARLDAGALTLSRLDFAGKALTLSAQGSRSAAGALDAQVKAGLADLAVVAPTLTGAMQLQTHVSGPADALAATGTASGELGAPGVKRGPLRLAFDLNGLPAAPSGSITADATLDGAPLSLAVDARRDAAGAVAATIRKADWRSLHAEGALTLAQGATLPLGRISLKVGRLGELAPFVGRPLSGSLSADARLETGAVTLRAEASNAGIPGSRVGHASIDARVTDPLHAPAIAADIALAGIEASGIGGSAKIALRGPQTALGIHADAALRLSGTPSHIVGGAVLDVPGKRVRLDSLQLTARDETVRLLAPATVRFGDQVAVDRLRLGARQAVLDVAGELSPRLDATATLRTPASIAAIASPGLLLDGTVALDARLTGTPARPSGTVRVNASGLRARTGPGRGVPPASVSGTVQLDGNSARIDGRIAAGAADLRVSGRAPLGAGALDLRGTGALDLAMLNPFVAAGGRQVRGRLNLDATVTGPLAAPQVSGTAQLAGGEVQDFTQGLRVSAITGTLRASGDTVRIERLSGRAGPGTIDVAGSIGVLAPGIPLDLSITAADARPLSSDRLTATLDARLTVHGPATGAMLAAGTVSIRRAEIRIPESLPPTVAALQVIRPGQVPSAAPPAGPAPSVNLDLTVSAPGQVFVRGRGLDAVMFGNIRVRGSASAPQVSGGFEMRNGSISAAGQTLTFTRGKVGFDGTSLGGKIDPTLDFSAENTTNSVTATLGIGGHASAPKITLTSVPSLPQDEVLSYLLFRRSVKDLGPFQIAEIAAALASLTGVGGGGAGGVLDSVRQGLGLDRLSVGGAATGSGASVEAGRYVANGVYVGAKQGTSGGTGATVQIDITKGLKLETEVGTGAGGNQVGLTYQFEY